MNPIKRDLVQRKIEIILSRLDLLRKLDLQKINASSDLMLQEALCHAMQNAIAAAIDIGQHICAEKLASAPETYTEAILQLAQAGVLDQEFADDFSRVAKLRNVLVHLYEHVDIGFIASLVPKFIADFTHFVERVRLSAL